MFLLLVDVKRYCCIERRVAKRENVQALLQLLNQLLCFWLVSDVLPDAFLDLLLCEPNPVVRCTTSALVCTSCTRDVQENDAICLVVLQTAEILELIIYFAIHFLCVTIE